MKRTSFIVGLVLGATTCLVMGQGSPMPLMHAHAHNDYLHQRPLLDALDQGFCSVEADIFLVEGKLLVAHERRRVKPERTLEALYLDPLRERVKRNGGRVFAGGPEFTLLIDLKTDWTNTYPVLCSVLTNYADMLTTFEGKEKRTNAVTVILSGSRSLEMFARETVRYAAYDGTPAELKAKATANLIPWISADWKKVFKWDGTGAMPETEHEKLVNLVSSAHKQGQRVRFWGGPDRVNVWQLLREADVDLVNTDDLSGLAEFLRKRQNN